MRIQRIRIAIPRELRGRALLAGILVATQSYCLYSAVALIPPALALLVFQTSPMLYVLLTWTLGKEPPRVLVLAPMFVALVGLALALNVSPDSCRRGQHPGRRRVGIRERLQHDGRLLPQRERAEGSGRPAAHASP